ncbi:unnamed protein product [Linum trigynum]|uniref:Uncharacterized protein n=1 Tax=Linum trigynum TaxID=586398 RepID=A0AAV2DDX7_9ROSI
MMGRTAHVRESVTAKEQGPVGSRGGVQQYKTNKQTNWAKRARIARAHCTHNGGIVPDCPFSLSSQPSGRRPHRPPVGGERSRIVTTSTTGPHATTLSEMKSQRQLSCGGHVAFVGNTRTGTGQRAVMIDWWEWEGTRGV